MLQVARFELDQARRAQSITRGYFFFGNAAGGGDREQTGICEDYKLFKSARSLAGMVSGVEPRMIPAWSPPIP